MGQDDVEYKCTLSAETQEIAKNELREEEGIRADSLRLMREWAIQNPCIIKCRTGKTLPLYTCFFFSDRREVSGLQA